ncbi:MAG: PspC domain-containing protein [Bacteroidales bacterium]|nr:PspC domain-containing protein [Bacteroidales bacterium]
MEKRLTRSNNRVIAGICAGIAEWLGWDIALVRILYLLLSIFSAAFPGTIAYIILWIVMPPKDSNTIYL